MFCFVVIFSFLASFCIDFFGYFFLLYRSVLIWMLYIIYFWEGGHHTNFNLLPWSESLSLPPPNSYAEILTPRWWHIVLGGRTFERAHELGSCPYGEKMVVCEPGSGHSSDTEYTGALILHFPASRTVGSKFLFISYLIYGILL